MLGDILKTLRDNRDIKQKAVASYINKSVQAYSQYELGKRDPDSDTLKDLADFFNVSVDYLLERTAYKNPPIRVERKDNLYTIYVGDLSKESISKINEYIQMLRKLEEK
ncbi:MAG: helix-turn-helix transcriptional regulator [Anaerovorax sp.]